MGDIDFLYKAEQDKTLQVAMQQLSFKYKARGRVHDIYTRDKCVVAEAHRELLSPSSPYSSFGVDIWNRAHLVHDYHHCYEMSLEDEIIFNVIHLASHFRKGGAGIRFFIDVWVYQLLDADWDYVESELQNLGLDKFYGNICMLSEKWFGSGDYNTSTILDMEQYVLAGGTFGLNKNRKDAVISNGRGSYLLRILFPSFRDMQSMFPWLKNKAFLPFAWIIRVVESLVKRRSNVRALLQALHSGDTKNATALTAFYNCCGL